MRGSFFPLCFETVIIMTLLPAFDETQKKVNECREKKMRLS